LSKENGGKKGDKAYAYVSCILQDCQAEISLG
jgi:hypothetical protein